MKGDRSIVGIVLTLNEAEHLPDCLRTLRPAVERVVVLDSGSTDATPRIALDAGACLLTRAFDGYASQRNAALAMVDSAGWVLFLDADERLTPAGAAEIRAAVADAPESVAAFQLPRRNTMFGRELRGGGWWPDWQTRLLRVGRARFDIERQVHEVALLVGDAMPLVEPLIHLNYASRREFLNKQAFYTHLRVQQALQRGATPRRRTYLAAPAREVWRRFVSLRGYRDGSAGLFLALALAREEARACWLIRHGTRA